MQGIGVLTKYGGRRPPMRPFPQGEGFNKHPTPVRSRLIWFQLRRELARMLCSRYGGVIKDIGFANHS